MSEYEENEIEKELNKCSKKVLIKIIMDNIYRFPFNQMKIKDIKRYRVNEKINKLEKEDEKIMKQFDDLDNEITLDALIKSKKLLEKSNAIQNQITKLQEKLY